MTIDPSAGHGPDRRLRSGIAVATFAVIVLGFFLGRYPLTWYAEEVDDFRRAETLGGLAGERRSEFARAFDDPARAEDEMDSYAWAVENVPTPFVGVAPRPGEHPGASINSLQMRGSKEVGPKAPGTVRIFLTGGSTAFGSGAPSDAHTVAGVLQERLDRELSPTTGLRYELFNAANPAWTSTHERILIENRLSELEPDVVVSLSGNNDAHFGYRGHDVLWFRTYAELHFATLTSRLMDDFGSGAFALDAAWEAEDPQPVAVDDVVYRLEKNAQLAASALNAVGARYVFALQPTLATTGKELSPREHAHAERESLGPRSVDYFVACYARFQERLGAAAWPGFTFVDASTAFDEHAATDEIFLDTCHFGDRGYRILADRLFVLLAPLLPAG